VIRRRAAALAASGALSMALLGAVPGLVASSAAAAATAPAPTPTEIDTYPTGDSGLIENESLVVAGSTGFLHRQDGTASLLWTDYATGTDTPVSGLSDTIVKQGGLDSTTAPAFPTGNGDTFAFTEPDSTAITVGDPATSRWTTWTAPDGGKPIAALGSRMLFVLGSGADATLQLMDYSSSSTGVPVDVTGLPDGAQIQTGAEDPTADATLVSWNTPATDAAAAQSGYSLLDLATGTAHTVPVVAPAGTTPHVSLSGGYVIMSSNPGQASGNPVATLTLYKVDDLLAGNDVQPVTLSAPGAVAVASATIVGSQLLVEFRPSTGDTAATGVYSMPLSGAAPVELFPVSVNASIYSLLGAADGGVLGVDRTSGGSSAIHRYRAAGDGSLSDSVVEKLAVLPSTPKSLIFAHGVLVQQVQTPYSFVSGGTGTQSYTYDVAADSGNGAAQYGDDLDAAVGPTTTWMAIDTWAASGAGKIRDSTTTVSTGVACTPTELQSSQHWLYWSCGASGPAGVYDLTTNKDIQVPSGPAMLGDGFVVEQGATDSASGLAELSLIDLHTDAVGATVDLGVVQPAGRGITWNVDRYGGDIAYIGGDRKVHVLSPGVPSSPITLARITSMSDLFGGHTSSSLWGELSAPVSGTELVITRVATGQKVADITGGPAREAYRGTWDGSALPGVKLVDGYYRWNLVLTPANGGPSTTVAGATFHDDEAAPAFRSYIDNGRPGFLGVRSTGAGTWYTGSAAGVISGNAYVQSPSTTETWTGTAIVPFGDVDGNRTNDVLVRDSSGVLWAYESAAGAQSYMNPQSVTKVKIGGGWNIYNLLVSTGDLNQDGHDDLIARDANGVLWLYEGTGTGGFHSRVQIGTGWGIYTKIVGTGDLTGDGIPDFIAVDSSGKLWRYSGNGKGGYAARVQIGYGYGIYNTIVPIGDVREDGHNGFVARDSAGGLWWYEGTGTGTVKARVKVGYGYNIFKQLY